MSMLAICICRQIGTDGLELSVTVNLNDVDSSVGRYEHTNSIEIVEIRWLGEGLYFRSIDFQLQIGGDDFQYHSLLERLQVAKGVDSFYFFFTPSILPTVTRHDLATPPIDSLPYPSILQTLQFVYMHIDNLPLRLPYIPTTPLIPRFYLGYATDFSLICQDTTFFLGFYYKRDNPLYTSAELCCAK